MFDIVIKNGGTIVLGLVVFWFAQFGGAYWQMRRFYRRMIVLRQGGLTAIGLCGDRFKGRTYAVLTIDENNKIVHAEKFTGWTVFATLQPVPELVGMPAQELINNPADLPVSNKLRTAFKHAAQDLLAAREKEAAKLMPSPV